MEAMQAKGGTKAGQMRLQREAKMAKKDYDAQVKKHGKIVDNFICLPDPENVYSWYFIIFGLEHPKGCKGGFYIGKITCPDDYPQKAPRIDMFTENGRFCTYPNFDHGICLSISHHHPESWNPVWKVNQIVIGLISFWLTDEHTWGDTQYDYRWPETGLEKSEQILAFAHDSVEHVKNHEKFFIFKDYIEFIGMDKREHLAEWDPVMEKLNKQKAEKAAQKAEEEKRKQVEAERIRIEKEAAEKEAKLAKEAEERAAKERVFKDYFKMLNKKGLNKYVGQPKKLKIIKINKVANPIPHEA